MVKNLLKGIARRGLGTITQVRTEEPVAALTYDDGPDPIFTPRVLDVLEAGDARGTFFMVGQAARQHPELVRRVSQEGHAVGNHSWDHPSFTLLGGHDRRRQIRACAEAIAPYGTKLFRPPFGHQNLGARLDAFLLGYKVVGWSILAEDWLDRDADFVASRILAELRPGSIVLLHDRLNNREEERFADRTNVVEATRLILDRASADYRFVSIPELLRYGAPARENWYWRGDEAWVQGPQPERNYQ